MDDDDKTEVTRNEKGQFVKGQSGNPAGKAPGTKNQITQLRENTELAMREYLNSEANRKKALRAIDRIFTIADTGGDKEAIAAMRLLFDKILPNARSGVEEESGRQRPVAIQIVNHTGETGKPPVTIVDAEPVE